MLLLSGGGRKKQTSGREHFVGRVKSARGRRKIPLLKISKTPGPLELLVSSNHSNPP